MQRITLSRAKKLEESINMFTAYYDDEHTLLSKEWMLTDKSGQKHKDSDELVLAVNRLNDSFKKIHEILNQ